MTRSQVHAKNEELNATLVAFKERMEARVWEARLMGFIWGASFATLAWTFINWTRN